MKFIVAKKVNMTQVFGENGAVEVATVLSTEPMIVAQIKTTEKDGYSAVQVGSGSRADKNISKPTKGHLKNIASVAVLKEFRAPAEVVSAFKVGDIIGLDTFSVGDKVTVSGITKGKGFQGVVKRHRFHGGPRSHGQKHSEREPGSIGGGGRAGGKVIKGMRMAGRMGSDRVTVKNLKVLQVYPETGSIVVSGAVPGRRGTLLEVRSN